MVEPATAMIIASAIAAAAQGAGQGIAGAQGKKAAKLRAKEMERETFANLLNESQNRGAELEAHRLASRGKLGKRRSQSLQDTADLVRGALSI